MVYDASFGNGSDDCTPVEYIKRYYLPFTYGIIFTVGLVGNVTAIVLYLTKMRPWKSSSIIMVNLAVADLLYVLSLPFLIHFYTTGDWTMGEFMCRFVRFGFHFNLYGSILFLTCLSVFRCLVVVRPLRAAQLQRKSCGVAACLAVWFISLNGIGPMLHMITSERRENNRTLCLDFASNDPEVLWWYGWLLTALGYLVPLAVVCASCACVARTLARGPHAGRPSRVRARRLTALVLAVFVACFMPYHVLRVLRVDSRRGDGSAAMRWSSTLRCWINAAYTLSRPLAGLNTFFNLALYTIAGDRFQEALCSLFHRRQRSSSTAAIIHTPNSHSNTDLPKI